MNSSNVSILSELPKPENFEQHTNTDYLFDTIWKWIDSKLLYNKLLGFKGNFNLSLEKKEKKAVQLYHDIKKVQSLVKNARSNLMSPKTIYQFFHCKKHNDTVYLLKNSDSKRTNTENIEGTIFFPRQTGRKFLSLSDYIHPDGDTIAIFVATCGEKVNEYAGRFKEEGEYKLSVILQSLSLASVEAVTELLHRHIREKWGIEDNNSLAIKDFSKRNYRGQRYSFGYPTCPNLEDQKIIWKLLEPQNIGVLLTEGFMMDPEALISAVVFHHPEAEFFKV